MKTKTYYILMRMNILYSWALSQSSLYDGIKFDKYVELQDILNNPGNSDMSYFNEGDIAYPDIMKKIKEFSILSLKET